MSLQEVMDRVPAVAGMIDEMNEIIPGVPATEKNLKTLLGELIDVCEEEENYDQTFELHPKAEHASCDFTLFEHHEGDREGDRVLVVYLKAPVTTLESGQKIREHIEHKSFELTPDGLLKGIVWAKQSLKRYREEGPCPDCRFTKRVKLEGFPSCFRCTLNKAVDIQ